MGMYTELVFASEIKRDTPKNVLDILEYMLDSDKERPDFKGAV